jgi:hypothetical protein
MLILLASASLAGCGGDDDDDVADVKKPIPIDQVPQVVMKTAREAAPGLTFYAAYSGTFKGKESIEVKYKTRSGQIKELEISPDGKLLGTE